MRIMIANAAPWSYALKQQYVADFPPESLFEVYGSTELGVNTIMRPEDQLRKPGSCGKEAPMVEIRLYDDDGNVVEGTGPEAAGELFVRSPSVFADYYKQHDKFEEDQPRRVPDRRRHRLPRRRGLPLHLRPQEGHDHLRRDEHLPGGDRGRAGEPTRTSSRRPCSASRARSGASRSTPSSSPGPAPTSTSEAVTAHAREHLAGYKVPRSISWMDELPKTGSGKLLKRELRAPYWADRTSKV